MPTFDSCGLVSGQHLATDLSFRMQLALHRPRKREEKCWQLPQSGWQVRLMQRTANCKRGEQFSLSD